jgi:hypothetical protein
LLTILTLLAACSNEAPAPAVAAFNQVEATAATVKMLCLAAEAAKQSCTVADSTVTVGSHKLAVVVTPTDFVALPPTELGMGAQAQLVGGEVQAVFSVVVDVDGVPLLSTTVHGIGSNTDLVAARAAALDQAAQRWVASYGLAVLDALAGGEDGPALAGVNFQAPPATHGSMRAYAAFPQLQGQRFDPKLSFRMGPNVESMGQALGPYLADLDSERLHVVVVTAKLGGGGPPGECGILPPVAMGDGAVTAIVPLGGGVVVDGGPSRSVCPLSEVVSWPLPQGGALLEWEQVFVVGRVAPAG